MTEPRSVELTTYKGVAIFVDVEGWFHATIGGQRLAFKTLEEVQWEIDNP